MAWLLPILERRTYAAAMRDREGAAKMAAIANLPIGWLFEDPLRDGEELVLRATGPDGDEVVVSAPHHRAGVEGHGGEPRCEG